MVLLGGIATTTPDLSAGRTGSIPTGWTIFSGPNMVMFRVAVNAANNLEAYVSITATD